MVVGYLGGIPFITSRNKVRTFDNFNRSSTARWAKHELIGQKPILEFLGKDIEKISFDMQLRASLGINPEDELDNLRTMRDEGTVLTLVLNNMPITDNFWVIESLDEKVNFFGGNGEILSAIVSISLQEYVGDIT